MPKPLDLLLEFLRFPSISTDSAHRDDVKRCADWLAQRCRDSGLHTEVIPTPRHPVVLAKNTHRAGRQTVLIYGHYDVQPVDPLDLWKSPPFEPRIENGVIYARGATDNKGQLMAHLCGVAESLRTHGDLPVNLTFLFEGEEEIGSPNLAPFLRERRDSLACDVIAISDTGMVAPGVGTFTYGLRGITCMEIVLTGPEVDLHSGIFGGAVANPAVMIARLVASLHDADGRVAVDGFYDAVRPVADWERTAWSQLPGGDEAIRQLTGVPALWGEAGFSECERRWARPTAEVNGIGAGYQGEGSKTVIPSRAFAKLSFRLVPDQKAEAIAAAVQAHLRRHAPPGVRMEIKCGHSGPSYIMDPNGRFGKAAQKALTRTFSGPVALIREGGSIPIVQNFREILGVETLLLGLALPDCQAHAPNENFPVANFDAGRRLNVSLLEELAKA
jgi:acetylornithine deacetylase/succinyl-diaminopimelate desuccinylase-like protein